VCKKCGCEKTTPFIFFMMFQLEAEAKVVRVWVKKGKRW